MSHPLTRSRMVAYIEFDNAFEYGRIDTTMHPLSEGEMDRVANRVQQVIAELTINGLKVKRCAVKRLEVKFGDPAETPKVSSPDS